MVAYREPDFVTFTLILRIVELNICNALHIFYFFVDAKKSEKKPGG
jgi:hypothetical protein